MVGGCTVVNHAVGAARVEIVRYPGSVVTYAQSATIEAALPAVSPRTDVTVPSFQKTIICRPGA